MSTLKDRALIALQGLSKVFDSSALVLYCAFRSTSRVQTHLINGCF